MDISDMVYQDTFSIAGKPHKGMRDRKKSEVLIPYTDAPAIAIGDTIIEQSGPNSIELQVMDVNYQPGGSLNVGTRHPHMLTLSVRNNTAAKHQPAAAPSSIHIASVTGHQVQVGNHNHQISNITLSEVVKQVAMSSDPEAKGLMKKVLENNTVAAIVGAGASALLTSFGA